jgi:hypothetical protein
MRILAEEEEKEDEEEGDLKRDEEFRSVCVVVTLSSFSASDFN